MDTICEKWIDKYSGVIPHEVYTCELSNGEEHGLIITLTGKKHEVVIDFGSVGAVQMVDEGMELHVSDGEDPSFMKLREKGFPSVLYLVQGSAYEALTAQRLGEALYRDLGYREYSVVTLNYVISVICQYAPEITVRPQAAK